MIGGTATVTLIPGAGLEGTAACDTSGLTPDLSGTATVSYATIAPWLAADRRTTVRVLINGEDIVGLLGDVTIENNTGTILSTATFQVADPRACLMAANSIIRGAQPIQILLTCDDGNGPATWTAFNGIIESVSNQDPYCPLATVKAISVSAEIFVHNAAGCVRAVPFGGYTRAQLLQAYALAAGFSLDMSGVPSTTIVRQPVDISGVSIESLLLRWGEPEGWYCRETAAGELEILTEAEVLSAPAKWNLTEDGYLSLREDGPNRPTTVLTIGGSQITLANDGYEAPVTYASVNRTTTALGAVHETTLENTYQYGVMLRSVSTERANYAPKGVTTLSETYQIINRITDVYTYVMVTIEIPPVIGYLPPGVSSVYSWSRDQEVYTVSVPTAQLLSSSHTVEGWYSPLDGIGSGHEWTDGTHHVDTYETFQMTGQTVTGQTYSGVDEPIPCRLMSKGDVTSGYYSPQAFLPMAGNLAITQGGTPGSTHYTYRCFFLDTSSRLIGFANNVETTTGNSSLDDTNYNIITPTFPTGAVTWFIERLASSGSGNGGVSPVSLEWYLPATETTHSDKGGFRSASPSGYPFLYDDGTYRSGAYSWRETERINETYFDNLAAVEAGTTGERQNKTDRVRYAWFTGAVTVALTAGAVEEFYDLDYTYSEIQSGIPNAQTSWLTKSQTNHDGSSSYSRTAQGITIADPIVASATAPQYSQTAMTFTLAASTDIYPMVTRTETIQDAENLVELERADRRRLRSEQAFRLAINLPAVSFLNVWDTIAVWDSVRGYAGTKGWVERISTKISALNGWFGQDIVIVIPPEGP